MICGGSLVEALDGSFSRIPVGVSLKNWNTHLESFDLAEEVTVTKFSETVKQEVFVRQRGRCAGCGRLLNRLLASTGMESIQFHHVIPQSLGGDSHASNGVALCTDTDPAKRDSSKDGCHGRAHTEYRYNSGFVAPPEYFVYSHGHQGGAEHDVWVLGLSTRFKAHAPLTGVRLASKD